MRLIRRLLAMAETPEWEGKANQLRSQKKSHEDDERLQVKVWNTTRRKISTSIHTQQDSIFFIYRTLVLLEGAFLWRGVCQETTLQTNLKGSTYKIGLGFRPQTLNKILPPKKGKGLGRIPTWQKGGNRRQTTLWDHPLSLVEPSLPRN